MSVGGSSASLGQEGLGAADDLLLDAADRVPHGCTRSAHVPSPPEFSCYSAYVDFSLGPEAYFHEFGFILEEEYCQLDSFEGSGVPHEPERVQMGRAGILEVLKAQCYPRQPARFVSPDLRQRPTQKPQRCFFLSHEEISRHHVWLDSRLHTPGCQAKATAGSIRKLEATRLCYEGGVEWKGQLLVEADGKVNLENIECDFCYGRCARAAEGDGVLLCS